MELSSETSRLENTYMADKEIKKVEIPTTVSAMFHKLEEEIQAVKDGNLPLDTARVVQRGRALQLKTAELNIQYARMNKAERNRNREVNLLTGGTESIISQDKVV